MHQLILSLYLIFYGSAQATDGNNEGTKLFFSTRQPSQTFINNYGIEAHQRFQNLSLEAVKELETYVTEVSISHDTANIKEYIDTIGRIRSKVARECDTKGKEKFGISRRRQDDYYGAGDFTPLFPDSYSQWCRQLYNLLTPILENMARTHRTNLSVRYRHSALDISIKNASAYDLTHLEREQLRTNPTDQMFERLTNYEIAFASSSYTQIDAIIWGPERARERAREIYQRFQDLYFIKASFSLKMGEEFVPTSSVFLRYLKAPNCDHPMGLSLRTVKELTTKGAMIYQHTLQIYLPKIEAALRQYYTLILKWTPNSNKSKEENEKKLKILLGGFHYIFDHLMPYARGSAAGAEWGVRALARSKGFDLSLKENVPASVVQEDLAQPDIAKFLTKWYGENVLLIPLQQ
jgi:hypothetical protein